MIDTKGTEGGRAGDSNPLASTTPQTPQTPGAAAPAHDAVDEARIIEEIVIPAEAPAARAEDKNPLPPPPVPAPPPAPAPLSPPTPPPAPHEINGGGTPAPPSMAMPPPAPETPPTPQPDALDTIQLPRTDVQKILGEIKLPERRITLEEAPKAKPRYDTSPASSLSSIGEKPKEPDASSLQISPKTSAETEASALQKTVEQLSSIVSPLRTLKNDFQDIVRDKKMSLVRATALEQDKKRDDSAYALDTAPRSRTFGIMFAAVLLALLGSAAFFGVALVMQGQKSATEPPSDTSLLFAESAIPLPLDNRSAFDIKELLAYMRSEGETVLGSITRVVPIMTGVPASPEASAEREATLEEFLLALNAQVSPELIRALGDEFFLGLHTVDKNAPLLVIPVLSYERAFAGMLEWEAMMNTDLAPAFTAIPALEVGSDGLLAKRQFKDIVMRNYDVRALSDDAGTVQLYYSFPTRNILIIAESPYSFAEILSRLRAERKL